MLTVDEARAETQAAYAKYQASEEAALARARAEAENRAREAAAAQQWLDEHFDRAVRVAIGRGYGAVVLSSAPSAVFAILRSKGWDVDPDRCVVRWAREHVLGGAWTAGLQER